MVQTTTQIAREAPFLEDYRRRLLDSLYGGTEVYKTGDTIPTGKKVGDKNLILKTAGSSYILVKS